MIFGGTSVFLVGFNLPISEFVIGSHLELTTIQEGRTGKTEVEKDLYQIIFFIKADQSIYRLQRKTKICKD